MTTLHSVLFDLINDGARWTEASEVPDDKRPELVRAWLDDADPSEMDEALSGGSNTKDECRTLALFACGMTSETASQYLLKRFWEGMSWRVDEAIERAREDVRAQQPEPLERVPYNWERVA